MGTTLSLTSSGTHTGTPPTFTHTLASNPTSTQESQNHANRTQQSQCPSYTSAGANFTNKNIARSSRKHATRKIKVTVTIIVDPFPTAGYSSARLSLRLKTGHNLIAHLLRDSHRGTTLTHSHTSIEPYQYTRVPKPHKQDPTIIVPLSYPGGDQLH